jgi:hypothetical protein
VLIAVHEFVHLVADEINPDLPLWLDEGVAVYFGPHDLYTAACQGQFPIEELPTFDQLEQEYASIPAADLFAFTAVEYIASQFRPAAIHELIRSPESFEKILGTDRASFEKGWRKYIREMCKGR